MLRSHTTLLSVRWPGTSGQAWPPIATSTDEPFSPVMLRSTRLGSLGCAITAVTFGTTCSEAYAGSSAVMPGESAEEVWIEVPCEFGSLKLTL